MSPPGGDDTPSDDGSDRSDGDNSRGQNQRRPAGQQSSEGPSSETGERPESLRTGPETDRGLSWLLTTDHTGITFAREFLGSVLAVALVGLLLFAISGVWPPMVAVESGSMEPHMYRGDLVFVMDDTRLVPEAAVMETGIVTHRGGTHADYQRFGDYGDVVIYEKNGGNDTPIIHRARFWVNESENWYDKADPSYLDGTDCEAIPNCPAPHAGFITKGDNNASNPSYDQVAGISSPVKPEWIKGTAEFRIPWLGHIRLQFATIFSTSDSVVNGHLATLQ